MSSPGEEYSTMTYARLGLRLLALVAAVALSAYLVAVATGA